MVCTYPFIIMNFKRCQDSFHTFKSKIRYKKTTKEIKTYSISWKNTNKTTTVVLKSCLNFFWKLTVFNFYWIYWGNTGVLNFLHLALRRKKLLWNIGLNPDLNKETKTSITLNLKLNTSNFYPIKNSEILSKPLPRFLLILKQ